MLEFEEELLKAADEILVLIRQQSLQNHFVSGTGRPIPLKVTSRSGQLMQAVTRATTRNDRVKVTITPSGMQILGEIKKTEYLHSLLIHEGGTRPVTVPMRRFFWAKWHQTGGEFRQFANAPAGSAENEMWSRLRYKNIISYKPRPYLINAVMEIASQIPEILRQHAFNGLKIEIEKIIAGVRTKL